VRSQALCIIVVEINGKASKLKHYKQHASQPGGPDWPNFAPWPIVYFWYLKNTWLHKCPKYLGNFLFTKTLIMTKYLLVYILGKFFIKSSGHPDASLCSSKLPFQAGCSCCFYCRFFSSAMPQSPSSTCPSSG
jgi:hypothetical protein